MPEEASAAAAWVVAKIIKAMGEAKLLAIKLASVKHQEKLRFSFACCRLEREQQEYRCCS